MRKVKIITDSTADLPKEIMAERGIDMVPLHIILGEESYPDDGSVDPGELFDFAEETGTLPKTAAVNEYQFEQAFQKWLGEDNDIFFMGISSKLSATMQAAISAAAKMDRERISVVDSLSLSSGTGLQILEAADMADGGAGLSEITEHAIKLRDKVQASFVVDTLRYLYMGGRCSKLASIVGSSLQLKPTLSLKEGEIVPGAKLRGRNYIDKYYELVMEHPERADPKRIFVTHCLAEKAGDIKKRLESDFGFENVIVSNASPTISVHCGPGTLGILYLYK